MEAQLIPSAMQDDESYRYTRSRWMAAGVDNFTTAPAQNPDMMEIATNVLPPLTNSWKRRFGYHTFVPSLDQGTATGGSVGEAILYGTGFDGLIGYVSTANAITQPAFAQPISVEFWFETTTTNGGYFVSLDSNQAVTTGDDAALGVLMNTNGTISFYINSTANIAYHVTTPGSYNDGSPHMVDATLTSGGAGNVATIYVDGNEVVSATLPGGMLAFTSYYWRLAEGPIDGGSGRGFPAVSFIQTFLSHVSIWPGALTAAQVLRHYVAIAGENGSQINYESVVKADSPTYFWYLTESVRAQPPATGIVLQKTSALVNAATTTIQFPNNTTLGNGIFVIVGTDNTVTPTVSDGLNTYTDETHQSKLYLFFAPVTNPGPTSIVISGSGSKQIAVLAFELQGLASSSPVDGAGSNSQSTPSSIFSTQGIGTTSSPDVVFSLVYSASRSSGFTTSLQSGTGFGLVESVTGSGNGLDTGYTIFLMAAYTTASAPGPFSGSWKSNVAGTYQGATIGFTVKPTPAATGTTAFDYGDTNNGTYTSTQITAENAQDIVMSGSNPYTGTFTPGASEPVTPGDQMFMLINVAPNSNVPSAIVTVTDSDSNTWTLVGTQQGWIDTSGIYTATTAMYTATASVAITSATPITVTVQLAGATSPQVRMFNYNALGAQDQIVSSSGSGSAITSGSYALSTTELNISWGAAWLSTTLNAPFSIVLASEGSESSFCANYVASGIITDSWTQTGASSSDNWVSTMVSFKTGSGYFLAESVVIS